MSERRGSAARPPERATLLAVDIGNTQTVLGVFAGERLLAFWRVSSGGVRTGDELTVLVRSLCADYEEDIRAGRVVIASVVPELTGEFVHMARRLYCVRPLIVTSETNLGMRLDVPDPTTVGADRIANAVAVSQGPLPAIVVDLGTATTFDVIARRRRYIGGAIAPGIRTSTEDLFRRAARLARVEICRPRRRIGRTTEESIQSGVFYGALGSIDGIVRQLEAQLRSEARVVATGGLAGLVASSSETIQEVDEALTLRGLARIAALNG